MIVATLLSALPSVAPGKTSVGVAVSNDVEVLVRGPIVAFAVPERSADGVPDSPSLHVFDTRDRSLTRLQLFGVPVGFCARFVIVLGFERLQGRDLNGDGDRDDFVLHAFDTQRREMFSTGLAADPIGSRAGDLACDRGRLAFAVLEPGQGASDLNADRDAGDAVLHLWTLHRRRVDNLGVAIPDPTQRLASVVRFARERLVVQIDEATQGGTDLNGDGDAGDRVVHVRDLSTGLTRNTGLATFAFEHAPDEASILVAAREEAQRRDLNGDGDLRDGVLHRVFLDSARVENLGLAAFPVPSPSGNVLALLVREPSNGDVDLNGDGDAFDTVLQVIPPGASAPVNTELPIAAGPLFAPNDHAVFVVSEESAARDLNGDGDRDDHVIHRLSSDPFAVVNTGLTVVDPFFVAGRQRAPVLVSEADQGRDLDGDGELDDVVLHVVELATGEITNTGRTDLLPVGFRLFKERFTPSLVVDDLASAVEGRLPFDFDGTRLPDIALSIFDLRRRRELPVARGVVLIPLIVPIPVATFLDGYALTVAPEAGRDLNGDGDTEDFVIQLVDYASGQITNTGIATSPAISVARAFGAGLRDALAIAVPEALQPGGAGVVDVNGDGDTDDLILHAVSLDDVDADGIFDFADDSVDAAPPLAR